ncbi:SIR2 family protein [Mucilaginibacter sp.]|uniref:SIR2 family protein n=1 Tax=Mucilaginibacter sp. TaxID=1882438 RepID=UPI0026215EFF|nr:SIR2 family protein [Mucilaginibacter sp.]MDB4919746.1 hypothetical protein [Mucilaginibacter sp.]
MNHILDINANEEALYPIFEKIFDSHGILFLGAGASVGEKVYLSKQIIEYYEEYLGKSLSEPNITKFVDILSADADFNRKHLDGEVEKMLRNLPVTAGHEILASIPWQEIITTNYDLLVEMAYDKIRSSSNHLYDIVPIRELAKLNYKKSNTEVKYIKLNGCISEKIKYPLAFSTNDFSRINKFYKNVLHELKDISDSTIFISMGYSYTDEFAKQFLEKFDSTGFRERRWIYNVDPFPNMSALPYYTQQRICIIKCSFQDFFLKYKKWEDKNLQVTIRRKKIVLSDNKLSPIQIPTRLSINLDNSISQLNANTRDKFVSELDFYKGEEPNYNLITRSVDVIKTNLLNDAKIQIENALHENGATFLPIFFLTGEYGIGKSTFTLRLIHEFLKNIDSNTVAYEISDFHRLKSEYIIELFKYVKAKFVIFYCDEVEVESTFKSLLELRRELSVEQFNDLNVFFLVPIRENILLKFKTHREIKKSYEINLSSKLSEAEVEELLEKLRSVGLVQFRDVSEKEELIRKVKDDYDNDSFLSLLKLVTNGTHSNDLVSAYDQLSKDAKQAFIFTALLHRHRLPLPAGWLKHAISTLDWDLFIEKVIKAEGKGLLLQQRMSSHGTEPDLYFKTKHPLIANELINQILPSQDKQYELYERLLKSVNPGITNSYLVNDLLKILIKEDNFSKAKINKLYDVAYVNLSDDPHFLLNFATNLQSRNNISDLKKGLEVLIYAESLFDYKNHRFIHRRGIINFELAKQFFEKDSTDSIVFKYLYEALDLFLTKQFLDPFSAYGYVDYVRCLIWENKNVLIDQEDKLQNRIKIEELLDLAERVVTDELSWVLSLKSQYVSSLRNGLSEVAYKAQLIELYENIYLRPYACILLYNYYQNQKIVDNEELNNLVSEMESYLDNKEVAKFLFKYYGRHLYDPNKRIKMFNLLRNDLFIEKDLPLQFNYFQFIAESYNANFGVGKSYLSKITSNYYNLNPEFHYLWSDPNGMVSIHESLIVKNSNNKFKMVRVINYQQSFKLIKGEYENYPVGQHVDVKLHFYLYGIMAEIVKSNNDQG